MAQSFIPYKPKPKKGAQAFNAFMEQLPGYMPALLVVAIIVVGYVGILIWQDIMSDNLEQLETRKAELESMLNSEEVGEVQLFAQRTRTLDNLIDDQNRLSEFFAPFQSSIHPLVQITGMELSADTGSLSIEGVTPTFETLGEQFIIWREQTDEFTSVSLSSFEQNAEGVIEFSFELNVSNSVLQ